MLSIIMPVWSQTPQLDGMVRNNLAHIKARTTLPHETVLIDNGSKYPLLLDSQNVLRFPENRGIAHAWNVGAERARGDVFCFINSDVEVYPGWDKPLYDAAQDRCIVFPLTDEGTGPKPSVGGVAGWCFAMSRKTFNNVGWFDETFSPAFYEDTDYFHRAWMLGIPFQFAEDSHVAHVRRTSARHLDNMNMLFLANRLRYSWKHNLDPEKSPPFYTT